MDAKELRIGNLVFDKDGKQVEICALSKDAVSYSENLIGSPVRWIKPIPLTKEWLVKFGYSVHPWGWVKEDMPLIAFSKEKYWVNFGNGFRIDLPYVHTLQNLEQLTIKNEH